MFSLLNITLFSSGSICQKVVLVFFKFNFPFFIISSVNYLLGQSTRECLECCFSVDYLRASSFAFSKCRPIPRLKSPTLFPNVLISSYPLSSTGNFSSEGRRLWRSVGVANQTGDIFSSCFSPGFHTVRSRLTNCVVSFRGSVQLPTVCLVGKKSRWRLKKCSINNCLIYENSYLV